MFKERVVLPTLVMVAVGMLMLCAYFVSETSSPLSGTRRPALEVRSLNGVPSRLPVPFLQRHILILFTPACAHCRTVLTNYSRLVRSHPFVLCFGISFGSISATDSLVKSSGIPFPVFLDRGASARTSFNVHRVPFVLYIDDRDIIRFTLAGSRSFREDSLLFMRFCRIGAPGVPGVGGQEGTANRSLPVAPSAEHTPSDEPAACLAGGMNVCTVPVGPRSACGCLRPPGGPPQAVGPLHYRSYFKKEDSSCVPRLQG